VGLFQTLSDEIPQLFSDGANHLARTFGDVCGILNQTHTPILTMLLVSFFGLRKMRFWTENAVL